VVFVWQVAVDARARGMGLASAMLMFLLMRDACKKIHYLETTVSPGNGPSQALFRGLAKRLKTTCSERLLFSREHFGGADHEEEMLFRIGPMRAAELSKTSLNEGDAREKIHGK